MRRREQSDPLEENKLRALDAYLPISLVAFNRKGTASNGSGTLVSIGSDVVVATAGHVVRDLIAKHWVELRLLSDPVGASTDPAGFDEWQGAIEERGCIASPERPIYPDVGAVVLKPEQARTLRERALPLSALDDPARRDLLLEHQRLAGFPADISTADVIRSLHLSTVVVDSCGADHSTARTAGITDDLGLHVDWSKHRVDGSVEDNWSAEGVSGGPLWTVGRSVPDRVWDPRDRARFVGIAFFEDARGTGAGCVRAVPLTEWARLVASYAEHLQRPTWPGLLADAGLLP